MPTSTSTAAAAIQLSKPQWLIIISINMLGPFSTDSYIPNLPQMTAEFACTTFAAGLTLQLNNVCKGLANVHLGSLSDRHGRRPVLLVTFCIYIVSTACASFAPSIGTLILCRIVQGYAEGNAVIASAITRDVLDDPNERARIMAVMGTLRPLTIVAAPSVGGLVGSVIGWRGIFLSQTVWGALNLLLVFSFLPETLRAQPETSVEVAANGADESDIDGSEEAGSLLRTRSDNNAGADGDGGSTPMDDHVAAEREVRSRRQDRTVEESLCTRIANLFAHRDYTVCVAVLAIFLGGIFSMLATIAFILQRWFGRSVSETGLWMGSIPITGIVAASLAASAIPRIGEGAPAKIIHAAMALLCVNVALLLLTAGGFGLWTPLYATVASTDWQGPVLFIAPIYAYAFCGFAIMPMANALLTQPFPHSAGLATGVQMQLQTLFGSIVSSVATATLPESGEPSNMLSILVVCSVSAVAAWFGGRALWGGRGGSRGGGDDMRGGSGGGGKGEYAQILTADV